MKILLVEDDLATSAALTEILAAHHYTVNLATDGQTGLTLAQTQPYDLILLDVMIPRLDGFSVCRQLRTQGYQNPILLLTAKGDSHDRIQGLDAGADDYLVKPFEVPELLARIRAALRRGKGISAVILWENVRFDTVACEVTCNDRPLRLTPKEYGLLELFLLNPRRIFSRSAMLDRLWDFAESPGEETVSTHIKCLRQKLKAAGAIDLIETVHGLGYRLREPSQHAGSTAPVTAAKEKTSPAKASPAARQAARTAKTWEKFKDTFSERAAFLAQAANALLTGDRNPELRDRAKQEAHKLAGSLGIFGLLTGSHLARAIEQQLQPDVTLDPPQVQALSDLVKQLQQELENASSASPTSPLLLIIDDDLILAEQVRTQALASGLRAELATNLTVARTMIAQTPPDAILLDLSVSNPADDGLRLLQELASQPPMPPTIVLTGRDSLSDRVEVARLGGVAFLQKPLPIDQILQAVAETLRSTTTAERDRVLVVDDDPIWLTMLTTLLQPWQLEITTLADPAQFWTVLNAVNPTLLMLDFAMPQFNGIELCQVIRRDPHWRHLPILFLSAHTESAAIDQAFAAGATDYINKSVDATVLVHQISRRLKHVRLL